MKTYTVRVTETYMADFSIEAESVLDACEKADELASEDFNLTAPENMTHRDCEAIGYVDE